MGNCDGLQALYPKEIAIIPSPLNYEIKFEEQFEISENKSQFPRSPNLDVVIHTPLSYFGIESKFTEPYNNGHNGIRQAYVDNISFWNGLPNLYDNLLFTLWAKVKQR